MFAAPPALARRALLAASAAVALGGLALLAGLSPALPPADARDPGGATPVTGAVPTARAVLGPSAVAPLDQEPPANLVVDPPLAKGLVVVQYRTENLRVVPVFGEAALAVSPRIGHIHVT